MFSAGVRRLLKDREMKVSVDEYIRNNLVEIMSSKTFFGLTDLQIVVVGELVLFFAHK